MTVSYEDAFRIVSNLMLPPEEIHTAITRRQDDPSPQWLRALWTVLAGGGRGEVLTWFSKFADELARASAFSGMSTSNTEPDQALAWLPDDRLRQIQAVLEVVWTKVGTWPQAAVGQSPTQEALQMRLWCTQVECAKDLSADPVAALRALAQAPQEDCIGGTLAVSMPILLVGSSASGGNQGCLAQLRLWRWFCPPIPGDQVAAAHRAQLHLLPTLTQACVPLTRRFAQSLETVAGWLRSLVAPERRLDTALVWDLAPLKGGYHLLSGPSASAAVGLAGIWLLDEEISPEWRQPMRRMNVSDFRSVYLSAELLRDGRLSGVGDIDVKDGALNLARLAQGELGRELPLYVAGDQVVKDDGLSLQLSPHETLLSVACALKARPMTPEQTRIAEALRQALAALPELPGPADQACPIHLPPQLPLNDLELGSALVELCTNSEAQRCTDPLHYALRCWAERGRTMRSERRGAYSGQVHQRFVNLQLSIKVARSAGDVAEAQERVAGADQPYRTLEQLLAAFEHGELRAECPSALLIEGAPGSGKSWLLQRHEQALCEQFVWYDQQGQGVDTATGKAPVLPLYLPLNLLPHDADPVDFYRRFLLEKYPDERLGLAQRLAPGQPRKNSYPFRLRLMIDGLNEVQAERDEDKRAQDAVIALWRAFRPDLPIVLGIRPGRDWRLDDPNVQFSVRKATLQTWRRKHIETYLSRRWGEGNERVREFLATLPEGSEHEKLLGTPLYLNLQCELWEAGATQLLANRAHLLAAMLWLRLGQELDSAAGCKALRTKDMVSASESRKARDFAVRPGQPPEFARQGWLLKGLFAQAKAQWLSALDVKPEARGQVSQPVPQVERSLLAAGLPETTLSEWFDAAEELGLIRRFRVNQSGACQFQFEHQVFGEWLASAELFYSGCHTGVQGGRRPDEQPLPEHWSDEALARLAHELAPPPLAHAAEHELEVQRVRTRKAWADPRLDDLLDEWRERGLSLPLAVLHDSLHLARNKPTGLSNELDEFQEFSFIQLDQVNSTGTWNFNKFGSCMVAWDEVVSESGCGSWFNDRDTWAAVCQRPEVWPVFRAAAQEAMAHRVGRQQCEALWDMGRLGLPPKGRLDDIVPLALDALDDENLLKWLGWMSTHGPWALFSSCLVHTRARLRRLRETSEDQAAAVTSLWAASSSKLLAVVNDGGALQEAPTEPEPPARFRTLRVVGGTDPRLRLQAGELLGAQGEPGSPEGDQLRFERIGQGLRLRHEYWLPVGGPGHRFRLGDPAFFHRGHSFFWVGDGPALPVLPAFQIAQLPVTVAEYRRFMDSGGYGSEAKPVPDWWVAVGRQAVKWLLQRRHSREALSPSTWGNRGFDNSLQPVTGVTFFEAAAYAAWASEHVYRDWLARLNQRTDGNRYSVRLPTEWEWEAAMRGPYLGPEDTYVVPWPGYGPETVPRRAPMLFNSSATGWGRPSPVGCWGASRSLLGLLDGAGNVRNWCANIFCNDPRNPDNGRPSSASADARPFPLHSLRGGGFNGAAETCKIGYRDVDAPNSVRHDNGFRLVLAVT